MKIIGFAQLHEERRKGNLDNWCRSMRGVCDEIYAVDQGSKDASEVLYDLYGMRVTYNDTNDFHNELRHKARLLELVKREQPDADWVFWMDGDTVLDARLTRDLLMEELDAVKAGGVELGHLNLWRNTSQYRTDSGFDSLNERGVRCLWRMTPDIKIVSMDGIHKQQYPDQSSWTRLSCSLIHLGFVRDEDIVERLRLYQRIEHPDVFNSDKYQRFFNEQGLTLEPLPVGAWPDWMELERTLPTTPFSEVWETAT